MNVSIRLAVPMLTIFCSDADYIVRICMIYTLLSEK
jgi:hypothetical protein